MAHHLNDGFLPECFQALKKDKAPGIDGVTVREYEERLEENLQELVVRLKGRNGDLNQSDGYTYRRMRRV